LNEIKWKLTEFIDPSHARKSIMGHLKACFPDHYAIGQELKAPLHDWLTNIIYDPNLDGELGERLRLWNNSCAHFTGNHRGCRHAADCGTFQWSGAVIPECVNNLRRFLRDTSEILLKVDRRYHTNFNESLNSTKAKLAPKTYAYPVSFEVRCCIAVLQRNDPDIWLGNLRARLNVAPLPAKFRRVLSQTTAKRAGDIKRRSTAQAKRAIPQRRKEYRTYVYGSQKPGKERQHIRAGEDGIGIDKQKPSDDKFNIFEFALSPRTVLVENVPGDADEARLRLRLAQHAVLTSFECRAVTYRGKDCLQALVTTGTEFQANSLVANTLGHRFKKARMRTSRPPFLDIIYERSVLISQIPDHMNHREVLALLKEIGDVCDFRLTGSHTGQIASCWFATNEAVEAILSEKVMTELYPWRVTRADKGRISAFMGEYMIDDVNMASPHSNQDDDDEGTDSEDIDEEVLTREPIGVLVDGDAVADDMNPAEIEFLFFPVSQLVEPEEAMLRESHSPDRSSQGQFRFRNLGNTCYIAATMQALFHVPWPHEFAKIWETLNTWLGLLHPSQELLYEVLAVYHAGPGADDIPDRIRRLARAFEGKTLSAIGDQQDAHEFLALLLEGSARPDKTWEALITGTCHDRITHENPQDNTEMTKPFTVLHLSVPAAPREHFQTVLTNIRRPERWQKDMVTNGGDIITVDHGEIHTTVRSMPPLLFLCLDRFSWQNDCSVKLTCLVDTPDEFPSEWVSEELPRRIYRLVGIIAHKGVRHTGHYIYAHRESPTDDMWTVYNDATIRTGHSDIPEVASFLSPPTDGNSDWTAYILVYYDQNFHLNEGRN